MQKIAEQHDECHSDELPRRLSILLGRSTAEEIFAATLSDAAGDEEIAFLLGEAARQLRAMGSDSMLELARVAALERQEPPCGR